MRLISWTLRSGSEHFSFGGIVLTTSFSTAQCYHYHFISAVGAQFEERQTKYRRFANIQCVIAGGTTLENCRMNNRVRRYGGSLAECGGCLLLQSGC
jgi:hypothetical protein